MKIAVFGAGNVGRTLGNGLKKSGHEVYFGVKNPDDPKNADLGRSNIGTLSDVSSNAEIIVLALPWREVQKSLQDLPNISGVIIIDCTNPIKKDFSGLEFGHTISGAEMIRAWCPGARVVKCFNQTGSSNMANPKYNTVKPVMFVASEDREARKVAASLARDIGFEALELPTLEHARLLEQLAWLWIELAIKDGLGPDIAFALLRR